MSNLSKSSLFHSDQQLSYAEILTPSQVKARIEITVLNFLKTLTNSPNPAIPNLPLTNRTSTNTHLTRGLFSNNNTSSIFLSHSLSKKSLSKSTSSKSFIRVWKVMEICYQILLQNKMVTQRELYYKLICTSPEYFHSQLQVNKSIQDVIALLKCTRQSLGIIASSRGLIAGRITLQEDDSNIVDCSLCGSSGYPITGDLNLLNTLIIKSDARYIVVIEKHAIFQRLAEDRVFNKIPCVLITAKGYPDIATRLLLHRISRIYPSLPILALVDWNPAGLAIICTYKYGSIGMGLEAYRYACDVKWLGLRGDDLRLVPEEALAQLKPKDLQIAKSLMSSEMLQDEYKEELELMVRSCERVEIEGLYCHGFDFLGKYLAKKIVQNDYI